MGEEAVIRRTPLPRTRESLAGDLRKLGVLSGTTLIVHSSLSSLGWVCGGSVTVVQALMDVVTASGTLIMPTHSADYSDPEHWEHPSVPSDWHQAIRDTMPAFDARTVPSRGMGRIAETFRTWPRVPRSSHPTSSFAAWGRYAERVVSDHSLDYSLGEQSPLARVYDLDGSVLLLGVGYDSNTSFHLAEYRAPGHREISAGAPILQDGRRLWHTYTDILLEPSNFREIGAAFEQVGHCRVWKVGSAEARLFPQRSAVDFAQRWLTARRGLRN